MTTQQQTQKKTFKVHINDKLVATVEAENDEQACAFVFSGRMFYAGATEFLKLNRKLFGKDVDCRSELYINVSQLGAILVVEEEKELENV